MTSCLINFYLFSFLPTDPISFPWCFVEQGINLAWPKRHSKKTLTALFIFYLGLYFTCFTLMALHVARFIATHFNFTIIRTVHAFMFSLYTCTCTLIV